MTNKRCLVFETLGKVSDLKIVEGQAKDGLMRLSGVFGVCGVRNNNNRIYDKDNYRQMVESLQKTIQESGCPGELEHPNSMNINLENVSHKIEEIQMNEDGTITGTIVLLNTPKGQIAQAIVEGGLPLYISSRAAGTMTNESGVNHVVLSTIKTYDLVGTPGFSQAKLTLKENQTLECLNESADDENQVWAIVEGDDLLGDDSGDDLLSDDSDKDEKKDKKKKKEDKKEEKSEDKEEKSDDKSEEDKEEPKVEEPKEDSKDEKTEDKESSKKEDEKLKKDDKKSEEKSDKNEDNKNNDNADINMKDLKEAIEKLADKVTSLEAELHVAKESLDNTSPVNYDAIQTWITEEFAPEFKANLMEEMDQTDLIDSKVNEAVETIATGVQNWVVEEFAPEVQNWITEEYSPEVQNWITEEFAPEVQNWITEEFAPEVQNWITEEFAPVIDGWITEEFAPEQMQKIEEKVNENVTSFMESQRAGRLEEIDSLLESIEDNSQSQLNKIVEDNKTEEKYKGVYVVENMPSEYIPSWQLLSEERKDAIIRSSKMYDFTKEGVLESFWANADLSTTPSNVNENKTEDVVSTYKNKIANAMKYLRH